MMGYEGPIRGLRKGFGMTILGFALDDQRVVIAADGVSMNAETPAPGMTSVATQPVNKIKAVEGTRLAWTLTGNAADNGRFKKWITGSGPYEDWDRFAALAGPKVFELDQGNLRRGHDAKTKREEIQRTEVLVAGELGGRLEVLILSHDGDAHFPRATGLPYGFVGVWGPTATVAWASVAAFNPGVSLTEPDTMRRFMEAFCSAAPGLERPIQVWYRDIDGSGGMVE